MTLEQVIARALELDEEIRELTALDELDEDQEARFDALDTEALELAEKRAKIEKREATAKRVAQLARDPERVEEVDPPQLMKRTADPYEPTPSVNRGELRDKALKAIEETRGYEMEDDVKHHISGLVERKDDARGTIANRVLATGSDTYKDAWLKKVTGRGDLMSNEERAAFVRAMSLTDGSGGFAVPFPIDPTLNLLGDGSSNPFRQISRVETITTDSWQGLASSEMTASWDAEAVEVSDDTTTFTQPAVTPHKASAFVPASIEIVGDYPSLVNDLAVLFVDAKDRLEATAMATGSGSAQPFGIVTAIDGTGNDISTVTTDVFAVADVYTAHETLGPRYRDRATWVANVAIINDIRQFGTADSHAFSVHLSDDAPLRILGRPIAESSAMDGVVTALAENNILVLGDFSNYLIADRVGFSIEYIPHLFSTTTNLPSGQRGWYAYWRVGADSINNDAFVLLNAT